MQHFCQVVAPTPFELRVSKAFAELDALADICDGRVDIVAQVHCKNLAIGQRCGQMKVVIGGSRAIDGSVKKYDPLVGQAEVDAGKPTKKDPR